MFCWNYASYNPNHENGFYFDCYDVGGCEGDIDECGNCQPPIVEENEEENEKDKEGATAKCCGDNLYLIDGDGTVITEENK